MIPWKSNVWVAALLAVLVIVRVGPAPAAEDGHHADRFAAAAAEGDDSKVDSLVRAWQAAEPASPEPYVAVANYYAAKAESRIEISSAPPGTGDLALEQGRKAGGIQASGVDRDAGAKAIASLEAAAPKFPDRLDIWFGLAYLHQAYGTFEGQFATLKKALAHAGKNPDGLWWADQKVTDPAGTIAEAAQGQIAHYLERDEPGDAERALQLAQAVHAAYPRHPFPINVIGYYHSGRQEWAAAITYFEKARELAPEDPVVLINLGIAYANQGHKEKARRCFEKILAGEAEPELRDDAAQRLAALR